MEKTLIYPTNQKKIYSEIKTKEFISIIFIVFFILLEYFEPLNFLDKLYFKHILALIYIIFLGFNTLKKSNIKYLKYIIFLSLILLIISFFTQLLNNSFGMHTIRELYFLIVPIFFSSIFITKVENFDRYIYAIFFTTIFCFIYSFASSGKLTFDNIKLMLNIFDNLINSNTVIESNMGQYFFLFSFYFFYRKKYFSGLVSTFLVFICAKRISMIFVLLFIPFFLYSNHCKKTNKLNNKKLVQFLLFAFFVAITLVINNLYSDSSFAQYFYQKTGLNLTTFTMSRDQIYSLATTSTIKYYGLGGTTQILEYYNYSGMTNLHNDLLMIFLDCGIIGLISFAYVFIYKMPKNIYSLFLITFCLFELLSAHYLGRGGLVFWTILYSLLLYFNKMEIKSYGKH